MKTRTEAEKLRRKSVVAAAACASLAAVPALSATHGHTWVAGVSIGVQVVLLSLAFRSFAQSKRLLKRPR